MLSTLITLLRIPYLCHFGSTSFVLLIWPKYGILNRVIRVCHSSWCLLPYLCKTLELDYDRDFQISFKVYGISLVDS